MVSRLLTLLLGFAVLASVLLPAGRAWADVIDGDWCATNDGRHLSIVATVVRQFLLGPLAVSDVEGDTDDPHHPARLVKYWRSRDRRFDRGPVPTVREANWLSNFASTNGTRTSKEWAILDQSVSRSS